VESVNGIIPGNVNHDVHVEFLIGWVVHVGGNGGANCRKRLTIFTYDVTIEIPFAGDRSVRVHGGKQSFFVRRYELSSDGRNIKHLPRFVIAGSLDEKGTATFLTFANRANNGVVGVMDRFEPMAFVRTVGLRPFQTI